MMFAEFQDLKEAMMAALKSFKRKFFVTSLPSQHPLLSSAIISLSPVSVRVGAAPRLPVVAHNAAFVYVGLPVGGPVPVSAVDTAFVGPAADTAFIVPATSPVFVQTLFVTPGSVVG